MRVLLCCSLGGEGHLVPVTGVARAMLRAGHEAMLLVPPALAASAKRTGVAYRVGSQPPRAFVEEIWDRVRRGPAEAVAGLIDRELFAGRCTGAMLPAAREARDSWRPHLIVREPCEYASAIVANESGIVQAQVAISLAEVEAEVRASVAPVIDGFAPGAAAAIASAPYLAPFPASLDPSPWADTRRFQWPRDTAGGLPGAQVEASWLARPVREEPLIYVTFGSVLGHLPGAAEVYRAALHAVAALPARVLMTVGRVVDPSSLEPVPENTRVERWVAQDAVLEHAALVVCHGGSGTTFGALAAGVPMVICPLFADQHRNGEIVACAGAGLVHAGQRPTPGALGRLGPEDADQLRAAIEQVLGEPGYARAARRLAAEIAGLPKLENIIDRLEREVADG